MSLWILYDSGFDDVIRNGPIAHEAVRGIKFVLHHFVPHEDPGA